MALSRAVFHDLSVGMVIPTKRKVKKKKKKKQFKCVLVRVFDLINFGLAEALGEWQNAALHFASSLPYPCPLRLLLPASPPFPLFPIF